MTDLTRVTYAKLDFKQATIGGHMSCCKTVIVPFEAHEDPRLLPVEGVMRQAFVFDQYEARIGGKHLVTQPENITEFNFGRIYTADEYIARLERLYRGDVYDDPDFMKKEKNSGATHVLDQDGTRMHIPNRCDVVILPFKVASANVTLGNTWPTTIAPVYMDGLSERGQKEIFTGHFHADRPKAA